MKVYYFSILIILVCLLSFSSQAKTIANCSSSSGYTYYIEGLVVSKEDAAFQKLSNIGWYNISRKVGR